MKNTFHQPIEIFQSKLQSNTQIPEKELHQKFVVLGNNRRKLTNELLALLPEIYEKGIYKKYSATIVEYAGKFGGLSKGVVKKRLNLEKYLKDKPKLKEAIKTEGVHKVALIAKLATAETENAWVDKVKNMSKASLFELAKEVRGKVENEKCEKGLFGMVDCGGGAVSFCKAAPQKVKIELEGELLFMFLKMKKKYGNNLSNYEVMRKILGEALGVDETKDKCLSGQTVGEERSKSFESLISEQSAVEPAVASGANIATQSTQQKVQKIPGKKVTRYVKVRIKKSALSSTNGKCAYPGCDKPSENLHHPERFAESRTHENLKPLCKIHHEFMHNGLVGNEQDSIQNWQLDLDGEPNGIDSLYRKYRKLASEFGRGIV